jgi:hypothetical protein
MAWIWADSPCNYKQVGLYKIKLNGLYTTDVRMCKRIYVEREHLEQNTHLTTIQCNFTNYKAQNTSATVNHILKKLKNA